MVTIASHRIRMNDRAETAKKISAEFAAMRGAHLSRLDPVEELLHALTPLPASYDVARGQPPYFNEFTYTELLGCVTICPQSSELAARVVQAAFEDDQVGDFDPVPEIMGRTQRDKYTLDAPVGPMPARVAFLPGSNIFNKAVCRETLTREMHADPDLVIKPHPLTSEDTLRTVGQLYGYKRILEPKSSGWAYLAAADEVLTTSTSEMGLYAMLLGKPVRNLTKVMHEARAPYSPIYRLLWGKPPGEAKETLSRILRLHGVGFLHPDDPDITAKAKSFFTLAMDLRAPFRPLTLEYDPGEYGAFVLGLMQRNA